MGNIIINYFKFVVVRELIKCFLFVFFNKILYFKELLERIKLIVI